MHAEPDGSSDGETTEHAHTNRLIHESSPYLLQHAHNPVDWYPWGDEAFEAARAQDKPVFLSVGYSTCHWCHVMERESFESEAIAAILNEHFICIKVDREERPDVDAVYMAAVQAISGRGGWPMSVFMMPDRKPFYGATYFPPDRFRQLLLNIARGWDEQRDSIASDAGRLTDAIRLDSTGEIVDLDTGTLDAAYGTFRRLYDSEHGGFGRAPKFPRTHSISFLLRYWKRTGAADAREMGAKTLRRMWRGGMYDHLGGGFHRYSTDREWLLPHFEKMLYDQALISLTYLEMYQATGDEFFAAVARDIFHYVLRDMTDEKGGFYSAEDADSEGEEGKFYLWSLQELIDALGDEDGRFFAGVYGATEEGNYREESRPGTRTGHNILHLPESLDDKAAGLGIGRAELDRRLAALREKLFDVREPRVHPYKDNKILTDWNGLMIAALARGGSVLDEPRYTRAAAKAAQFLLDTCRDDKGRLLHRYRNGDVDIAAFLDDYAFLAFGLVELFEATFEPRWLSESVWAANEMLRLFWDEKGKALYLSADDGERLLKRSKEVYDGAVPSGNSTAALVLLRLGRLTSNQAFETRAQEVIAAFSASLTQQPGGSPMLLQALDFHIGPSREIVIAGAPDDPVVRGMLAAVRERFLPSKVIALHPVAADAAEALTTLVPFMKPQIARAGRATAYVCENYACRLPVADVAGLVKLLEDAPR